jgi:hypothetical protein
MSQVTDWPDGPHCPRCDQIETELLAAEIEAEQGRLCLGCGRRVFDGLCEFCDVGVADHQPPDPMCPHCGHGIISEDAAGPDWWHCDHCDYRAHEDEFFTEDFEAWKAALPPAGARGRVKIRIEPKYKYLWIHKILITWGCGLFIGYYPDYENCKWWIERGQ